ncbi:MAG: hypothetical protein JW904_00890 [Spirochaetales bacterium]|nr:hypothetical protein [Spirochaetales bacterium]
MNENRKSPEKKKYPFSDVFPSHSFWTRLLSVLAFLAGGGLCIFGFSALLVDFTVFAIFIIISLYFLSMGALLLGISNSMTLYLKEHTITRFQGVVCAVRRYFRFMGISAIAIIVISIAVLVIFYFIRGESGLFL